MTRPETPKRRGPTRRAFLAGAGAAGAAALLAGGHVPRAAAQAAAAPPSAGGGDSGFRLEETDDGHVLIHDGGRLVLAYIVRDRLAPGVPERYRRSCYCHPACAPDGTVLTDDFPRDHYHHRGISWMWPRMKARGRAVQTWHLVGLYQRFARWNRRAAGPEALDGSPGAVLDVTNDWVLEDGERAGRERVRIAVGPVEGRGRAIDFTLTFEAVGGPVELLGAEKKGYGGFCFRFAPRTETVITTPAGRLPKDTNDGTYPWADLSARFQGGRGVTGAAVFVHPATPPAFKPRGWTLRHYGFLGPSWPRLEPYTLRPGRPVTLAYRVFVHDGDVRAARVAEAYARYAAAPPAVQWRSEG